MIETKMNFELGKKIKSLRLTSELTQEELANRAKLTKGFISQVENENFETSISLDSLSDILDALGVSLSDFFKDTKEPQIVYTKSERIQIENTGAKSFEILIPGSTNNEMDPILVELSAGEQLEKADPHPGEQFGYVLKGTLTLIKNKKEYEIKKYDCFYFTSDEHHQLLNRSDKTCMFIWVVTPPQM